MSVSSSLILPGPFKTISVNPEIVVIVAPDVSAVDPSVGAEYPVIVPQEDVVPSVVRYFPFCPDCDGTTYIDVVSRDTVTVPDVPPPVRPVPAVTPLISPSFATQADPL